MKLLLMMLVHQLQVGVKTRTFDINPLITFRYKEFNTNNKLEFSLKSNETLLPKFV
jgi:hypothetical protein